jgi:hypothetical protein
MIAERERKGKRRGDECCHGQAPDHPPPPGEQAGGRNAAVPALGSVVGGLGVPAIRSQHGTEPQADTPQQVGVTPEVMREHRPAEVERGR